MTAKTNACRILDRLEIAYELRLYRPDAEDLSAERLSSELAMPQEQIFKTLLVRGDRTGLIFAVIPAARQLDLKALARASSNRKVALVPLKEVRPLTGYARGSVTALAGKRDYPVIVDAACTALEHMGVSAGALGEEMVLSPADYLRATNGKAAPITE
ncbi:MAG TPA: aminoacyl-tRNA deacylase [Anaeromyxobacteraceae bacterium]|nr:aminoacyl-tRNA deacylase [Anaeromyxobacteraceae bacterium]